MQFFSISSYQQKPTATIQPKKPQTTDDDSIYYNLMNCSKQLIMDKLDQKYPQDILIGLKQIIALYLQKKDITDFIPKIVQLLPNDSQEIKRFCHYLVNELSCKQSNRDLLLMSISPLHKEILNINTIQRGNAFKTLSNMKLPEISSILIATLGRILMDNSAYVRRLGAIGIQKIVDFSDDEDIDSEQMLHFLRFQLKDNCYVRGLSMIIIHQMNYQGDLSYLHSYFRKAVKELIQFPIQDLPGILQILNQYANIYLVNSEHIETEELKNLQAQDLALFLNECEVLLKIPSPSVLCELGNIFLQHGNQTQLKNLSKQLIRYLNMSSETKFVLLLILEQLSIKHPHLLRDHITIFFVLSLEKLFCKIKKLDILINLLDDKNSTKILDELQYQTRSDNEIVVKHVVKLLGNLAIQNQKYITRCSKILISLLKNKFNTQQDIIVTALSKIILHDPKGNIPILVYCLKIIPNLKGHIPKSNIIQILLNQCDQIPSLTLEFIRNMANQFKDQQMDIKIQLIDLCLSLLLKSNQEWQHLDFLLKTTLYFINLANFDQEILVRDYGRCIKNLIYQHMKQKNTQTHEDIYKYSVENLNELKQYLKSSQIQLFDPINFLKQNENKQNQSQKFLIGSISNLLAYKYNGYLPNESIVCKLTTHHLRNLNENLKLNRMQADQDEIQNESEQIQENQDQNQWSFENHQLQTDQIEVVSSQSVQKKQEDEEIKNHFKNLEDKLDDFFDDD